MAPHSESTILEEKSPLRLTQEHPIAKDLETDFERFERRRREIIARNRAMLAELGVPQAVHNLQEPHEVNQASSKPRGRKRKDADAPPTQPARASRRLAGTVPEVQNADQIIDTLETKNGNLIALRDALPPQQEALIGLMTQEEYCALNKIDTSTSIVSDGHFHGWIPNDLCERYGIASSSSAAWEANGGGAFSLKIDKKAIPAAVKAKGWSDAKAFAFTNMKKNPNSYFYRHVAPDEEQQVGEWTDEEHELFLETARKFGVGDKWGLFASYVKTRVGYQCSAYYREVIIPRGLVLDKRWLLSSDGKAEFNGGKENNS